MSVTRTKIMCPNCFKGKLLYDSRDKQCWCDRCGQQFERVGDTGVKYK